MASRSDRGGAAVGAFRPPGLVVLLAAAFLLPGCATRSVESAAWAHVRATADHDAQLHRWRPGSELVVDVSALTERDSAAVVHAFDAWLDERNVPVSVRVAGGGAGANVVFRDVGEIDEGYESMGRTTLEWEGPWLVRAEVELARSSRCGSFLSSTERRRALLHEVGHVLGLGHSPRLSSIMHRNTPGTSVDDRDRAALGLLYAVASTRVVAAEAAPDTR